MSEHSNVPALLEWTAAILAIPGFIITVWVMLEVASIRRSFTARARLPELLRELNKATRVLATALGKWPSEQQDALAAFAGIRAQLLTIAPKVARYDRMQFTALTYKLQPFEWFGLVKPLHDRPPEYVWHLYFEILTAAEWLRQHERDLRWS